MTLPFKIGILYDNTVDKEILMETLSGLGKY
jgi:uncharacterized membrane protein